MSLPILVDTLRGYTSQLALLQPVSSEELRQLTRRFCHDCAAAGLDVETVRGLARLCAVEARRPHAHLPERVSALVDLVAVESSARP